MMDFEMSVGVASCCRM